MKIPSLKGPTSTLDLISNSASTRELAALALFDQPTTNLGLMRIGDSAASVLYVGDNLVSAAYVGDAQVF